MKRERHFLLGGAGLVKGKVRNDGLAMVAVCDSLEPVLAGCLADAPFETISLIVRYGNETTDRVEIGRINKAYSELPVSVQVDISALQAVQSNQVELERAFRLHSIRALRAVAEKYHLYKLNGAIEESSNKQMQRMELRQ